MELKLKKNLMIGDKQNLNKYRLILLFLSVFFAIVILEIVLQINFCLKNKNKVNSIETKEEEIANEYSKLSYVYRPYILWRAMPNLQSKTFRTNSLGLRGQEFQKNKNSNVFRIIILGGSAAWGYGASSDEMTIGVQLEKELQKNISKSNKKIEVLSFAENGFSSSQELILWNEISEYNPDLVIHYTGYNDIYVGFLGLKPGWNHPFIKESLLLTKNNWQIIFGLLNIQVNNFLQNFRLYDSIKYRIFNNQKNILKSPNPDKTFSDLKKVTDIFVKNMFFSQQIAKSKNIRLVIVLQPSLFTEQKILTDEENKILNDFEKKSPLSSDYFRKGYQYFIDGFLESKIPFVDGLNFFKDEKDSIYFDPVHCFDEGNKRVAKILSNIIFPDIN